MTTETWKRYGRTTCAHLFLDGQQACSTQHCWYASLSEAERAKLVGPRLAPLTVFGVPFGRICSRCHGLWEERGRAREAKDSAVQIAPFGPTSQDKRNC